jgi:hypothetical protein
LLRKRCAQWALIVKDVTRAGGEPFVIDSVWICSDFPGPRSGGEGMNVILSLTDEERAGLSRKVSEANKQSQQRPKQ